MMSESSELNVPTGKQTSIVDSWGVLEWAYKNDPAHELMRERLESASSGQVRLVLCRLNQGEIGYNLVKELGLDLADELRAQVADLPFEVVSVDDDLVDAAAELKARFPAPVLTGDPDFQRLAAKGILRLDWIGS